MKGDFGAAFVKLFAMIEIAAAGFIWERSADWKWNVYLRILAVVLAFCGIIFLSFSL